jgi:hypothetical protein
VSLLSNVIGKISALTVSRAIRTTNASITAVLQKREAERIGRVELYWRMYQGAHWEFVREEGEMPYVNLCQTFVNKSKSWLVGNPPEIRSSKKLQPILKHLYRELLENSGGPKFYDELCQVGGVAGDVIIRVGYDETVNEGEGGVAFKVMDMTRTFWEYSNVGQSKKLTRVMTIWDELMDNGRVQTIAEIWDDKEVRYYGYVDALGTLLPGANKLFTEQENPLDFVRQDEHGAALVLPNPYGELPFVHIKNIEMSNDSHGRSDLHDLWVLNKELNSALLSYKDNVDYHGNPLTLVFGIGLKDIEKGANKIWANLPTEGRVENLEVTQTFNMIQEYVKYMREFASVTSGIPEGSLGMQQPISNTSAAALQFQFLPLTEITRLKRLTYGEGIKMCYEKGLRFMNKIDKLGLDKLTGVDEELLRTEASIMREASELVAEEAAKLTADILETQNELAALTGNADGNPQESTPPDATGDTQNASPTLDDVHPDDIDTPEEPDFEADEPSDSLFTTDDYANMLEIIGNIKEMRKRPFYFTTVAFKEALPRDEVTTLSTAEIKKRLALTTRERILTDLGDEDPATTLKEVDREAIALAHLSAKVGAISGENLDGTPFTAPAGPPPDQTPAQVQDATGQPAEDVAMKRATGGVA